MSTFMCAQIRRRLHDEARRQNSLNLAKILHEQKRKRKREEDKDELEGNQEWGQTWEVTKAVLGFLKPLEDSPSPPPEIVLKLLEDWVTVKLKKLNQGGPSVRPWKKMRSMVSICSKGVEKEKPVIKPLLFGPGLGFR